MESSWMQRHCFDYKARFVSRQLERDLTRSSRVSHALACYTGLKSTYEVPGTLKQTRQAGWMHERKRGYVAYMLRLWQVRVGEEWSWRVSLEHAHTGARKGFTSLEELCAYLQEHVIHPTSSPVQQSARIGRSAQQGQAESPPKKGATK